jgi:transcription elongation factor Elf1
MLYIDHKYVGLISNRLQRFTRLNPKTYTFRCPICGDSKRNTYKTRGYLYEKKDKMLFYCHNCHVSMLFSNFLKNQDDRLYQEYVQEKFINKTENIDTGAVDITKFEPPKFRVESPLKDLKKISQLAADHPAKKYVIRRRIPARTHHKLFYAPRFKTWVNTFIPEKFNLDTGDEPRLILPFLDKDQNCFGLQGRSFKPDGLRYITIMFDESMPKIFGYESVDVSKRVYVIEGPIDSLFIDNCVAMAGADLTIDRLPGKWTQDMVFIFDNEPRNKQIVDRMDKVLDLGYNIVIWPSGLEHKDVNDMIIAGMSESDIKTIIEQNTCGGLSAKMTLSQWKKI